MRELGGVKTEISVWTFFWILYIPCIFMFIGIGDIRFSLCMMLLLGFFMAFPIIIWEELGKPLNFIGGLLSIVAGMVLLLGLIDLVRKMKENMEMKKNVIYFLVAVFCLFIFSIAYCPPHQLNIIQKETDNGIVWVNKKYGFEYSQKEAELILAHNKWLNESCLLKQLEIRYGKPYRILHSTNYGTYAVSSKTGRRDIRTEKDQEGIERYYDHSNVNRYEEEVSKNEYLRNYGKPPVENGDTIPPHKPYKATPYYDSGLTDELDKIEMENKIRRLETEVDYLNSQISAYGY